MCGATFPGSATMLLQEYINTYFANVIGAVTRLNQGVLNSSTIPFQTKWGNFSSGES